MDNFDLWTKQNIIDIIFNFNEKNYDLLRSFIKWYDIKNNYTYILSTRYFYSNECLKVLLSTIDAFIDVKNNDISKEVDIVNELEKEIYISEEVVVNELEKEIDIKKDLVINELEKKNDSDEYVINDDYYFTKDIVKKEENDKDAEDDDADDDDADDDDDDAEDDDADDDDADDADDADDDAEDDDDDDDADDADDDAEDDDADDADDDAEDDVEDNLIINKFSNNEIVLLLNILEEDTKKFRKHNYIICKFKEKLFFYNNFYLGFTTGLLFYFLFKFV